MWAEINLGSNVITNVPGVILVQTERGTKELMSLEVGSRSQQVLMTIDVYDEHGQHVAKLRRNAWVFNSDERYEITTAPSSLQLLNRQSGALVLEANVLDRHRVQVLHADLYTPWGDHVEIGPDHVVFGHGITLTGNHFDGQGKGAAIVLGPMGFALGAAT